MTDTDTCLTLSSGLKLEKNSRLFSTTMSLLKLEKPLNPTLHKNSIQCRSKDMPHDTNKA